MNENSSEANTARESTLRRLRGLRHVLLRLHKALLDSERSLYEQAHGTVSSGELLQLVINHEQFAWLRSISELIVRIDETLDADEPAIESDLEALFAEARSLLSPSETGTDFERKYYAAIQRDPDIVLAHREVKNLL